MSKFIIVENGSFLTFISSEKERFTKDFSKDLETKDKILNSDDELEIKNYFCPKIKENQKKLEEFETFIKRIENSELVNLEGNILTIPSVSKMSAPPDLVSKIVEAEEKNDEIALKSYLNFWKLCTLNPSEVTRQNLFWFLNKNGMIVTESGLFVAYRNVIIKGKEFLNLNFSKAITDNYLKVKNWKKSASNYNLWFNKETKEYLIRPLYVILEKISCEENDDQEELYYDYNYGYEDDDYEEENCKNIYELKGNLEELYNSFKELLDSNKAIFTDAYTKSTTIVIGKPVSIPRENCDDDNEVTCSRGLHVASKDWLQENYFGDIGLVCLVNPKNVVAVPYKDDYGKMRCCEYLPIGFSSRNEEGNLIDNIESGYKDDIKVDYNGPEGEDSNFRLKEVKKQSFKDSNLKDLIEDLKDFIHKDKL